MQEKLRKDVKIARAVNEEWTYKEFAEVINITPNSFYNWLNGYYELSEEKERQLKDLIADLII